MKLSGVLAFFFCFLMTAGQASGQNNNNRWVMERDSVTISVTCLSESMIHVEVYPRRRQGVQKSLVVDDRKFHPAADRIKWKKGAFQTDRLSIVYDELQDRLAFYDRETREQIVSESYRQLKPVEICEDKGFQVEQGFQVQEDEALYGLGQYQEGVFDYRGKVVKLVHANREIANPVLVSSRNYIIFWDNYSKTTFSESDGKASFVSELGDGVSYYFVYGKDMNDAVAKFRDLTGQVPMLPKSAFGFWMSKERYKSFAELTEVVAEYRKRKIPLDNIVQDWQYWGEDFGQWNSMNFDTARFAHPKEAIDRLHEDYHVKLTVSVWPGVGKKTRIYQEMDSAGVLFEVPTWAGYKVVDIYDTVARQIYWRHLHDGLYTKGVDSWWMDATEPSFRDGLDQDKQVYWSKLAGQTAIGSFARYLNTYSLVLSGMLYDNLRKQSDKRVSILTRSAFAGQQRFGTSVWSGDIYASWEVLRKQIPAGLNLCMTGIPYWTTDIGGFRVISQESGGIKAQGEIGESDYRNGTSKDGGYQRGLQDSAYLELYTRWFQYGAFCPMFRAHGTEVPREIWHFGEPGTLYYDAQLKMIDLRYSLMPYIYSAAWQVTSAGATMMRPLVMDFAGDHRTRGDAGSFMFGKSLLVHPVTRPMYHDREGRMEHPDTLVKIYLPQHRGKCWFDFNSDRYYLAGDTVEYAAPLGVIPVFVKAGAIVPRNKPVQYVGEKQAKEMELVVYTGMDADFMLYEDDHETYGYEQGEYSAIGIRWNEKKGVLSLAVCKGKPDYLLPCRFQVKMVYLQKEGRVKTVRKDILYTGQPLKVKFKKKEL